MKFTGGLIELFTIVGWTPDVFKKEVDKYVRSKGCETPQDILATLKSLTFTSSVCGGTLQCCPPQAKDNEIFRDIHLFCLPRGVRVQNTRGPTTAHNFVLTNIKGDRYNACALSFFEPVEYVHITTSEKSKSIKSYKEQLWFSKAICVVSKYAFSDMLKDFLIGIYDIIFHEKQSTIPIEAYVNALLWQLPVLEFPLNLEMIMKIGTRVLRIPPQPNTSHFPFVNFSMKEFFQAMDLNNIMKIVAAILTEKQILFSSSSYTLLYLATETITTLLFPFNWYHVYVPLLPNNLIDYLGAPTPFIMGIHSDLLAVVPNYGTEIVIVDLDANTVEHTCEIPSLPIEGVHLRKSLTKLLKPAQANLDVVETFDNLALSNNNNNNNAYEGNNNNWEEIQKKIRVEFFLFFATMLSSYKHFISDQEEFIKDEFIQFQPKSSQPFLELFVDTQAFSQFKHNPALSKLFDAAQEFNAITMTDLQGFLMGHFFEAGSEYSIKVPLLHPGSALSASASFDNKASFLSPVPHLDLAKVGGTSNTKLLKSTDDLAMRNRRGIYGTWKKHETLDFLLLSSKDFNPKDFLMTYENKFPQLEDQLTVKASDFRMLVTDITKNLEHVLKSLESMPFENSHKQKLSDTALSFYYMRSMLFLESRQILLALQDLEKILEISPSFLFKPNLLDYLVETLEELESSPEFYQSNKVYPLSVGDRVRKLIAEHASSLRAPRVRSKSAYEDVLDDWQEINPKSYQEDMEDISVFLDSLPTIQNCSEDRKLSQTDFVEYCQNHHFPYKRKLILKVFNLLKDPKTALINVDKLTKALLDIKARRPKYQSVHLIDYREICFMQGTASSVGARGSLILTNEKLIFVDKQKSISKEEITDVSIKLDSIVSVEKYNFVVVIPPGVPCVRVHYKPAKSTQTKTVTFCILKERHVWYRIIKEITLAYRISRDLGEPKILMQTFHKVMLTEAITMINKKPAKGLLSLYNSSTEWMTIKKTLESEPMNVLNEPPKEPMELKRTPSGKIAAGPLHPLEIAEIMLISVVELFFSSLAVDGCHIEFGKVLNSPEYFHFRLLSTQLHTVDLSCLTTEECSAFFLNIFNCLTIHSLLLVGFPVTKTEWRYLTRSACYTIGSLPFTLDFIKHGILRSNQPHSLSSTVQSPNMLTASGSRRGSIRDERSPVCSHFRGKSGEFSSEDPRLAAVRNAPKFLDARIHFAISFHNRSSPPIRLFKPDKLDTYLNVATAEFLQEFVIISEKSREVILPKIFKWYRQDFGGSDLLEWILLHLNGTQKKELNNLMTDLVQYNKPFKVIYKYDWSPFPRPFRQFL